jgi:hypothetical protein
MLSTYAVCIGSNIADLTGFLQAEVQGAQLNPRSQAQLVHWCHASSAKWVLSATWLVMNSIHAVLRSGRKSGNVAANSVVLNSVQCQYCMLALHANSAVCSVSTAC